METKVLLIVAVLAALSTAFCKENVNAEVIVIGAGISGIVAAKALVEAGVEDIIILEATDIIGGRIRKHNFGGVQIEIGANWVQGVGGPDENPVWRLAKDVNLSTFLSDYSNISANTYNESGYVSEEDAAAAWDKAAASYEFSDDLAQLYVDEGLADISILVSQRLNHTIPSTPIEMVADYFNTDWEFAEPPRVTSLKNTHQGSVFDAYGDDNRLVADSRGYVSIVHFLAESFLKSEPGCCGVRNITDSRLKLNKVVKSVRYNIRGGTVRTSDNSVYSAKHVILTVSVGVIQSESISFRPDLPEWKLKSLFQFNMAIYTKIFLKFPRVFWPTGSSGTEFFVYADERRGYFPVWQHLENAYPGSAVLIATVTDDESRRIEQQDNQQTLAEAMVVLRKMFGPDIPDATDIFVPRWWKDPYFRGSYSNWPIGVDHRHFVLMQRPLARLYFAGEHTSESLNGLIQGAIESGERVAGEVLNCMNGTRCSKHALKQPAVRAREGDIAGRF